MRTKEIHYPSILASNRADVTSIQESRSVFLIIRQFQRQRAGQQKRHSTRTLGKGVSFSRLESRGLLLFDRETTEPPFCASYADKADIGLVRTSDRNAYIFITGSSGLVMSSFGTSNTNPVVYSGFSPFMTDFIVSA